MIHIQKQHVSKKIMETVTALKAEDAWKKASDVDTDILRGYFDRLDKDIVRKELHKEQHGLCAYCMRRIKDDASMAIEHWMPIKKEPGDNSWNKDLVLDYKNMLGCCDGGRKSEDKNKIFSCDAAKGNTKTTLSPLNEAHINKIVYKTDGMIVTRPKDKVLEHDINDVLHLNGQLDASGRIMHDTSTCLVMGRRDVYNDYVVLMDELGRRHDNDKTKIRNEIVHMIEKLEQKCIYPQFAGVMLFFLRRKIRYIV